MPQANRPSVWRCAAIACGLSGPLAWTVPAWAGIDAFVAGCVRHHADLARLGPDLVAAGAAEIDPMRGPHPPVDLGRFTHPRTWMSASDGQPGDGYTGTLADRDLAVEICWHVSRPGESASAALPALKQRFPPEPGSTEPSVVDFYGGEERWVTQLDGVYLWIGVIWPMQLQPEVGTSVLFLLQERPPPPKPNLHR